MSDKTTYKRQIHDKLQRFGVSGPARDWLLRALHPASEEKCPGLPDQSATPVFRPDYRINTTIQAPFGASAWDCFIWTPPGDVNALFWATGPAGTDFTQALAPPGCQSGVVRLQQSSTTQQTVQFFDVNNPAITQAALTQNPATKPAGFRHMFKSITITQIASAVADQGQVYAAQYAPNIRQVGMNIPVGYDSGVPDPANPGLNYPLYAAGYSTVLPASEGDLTAMSPDFYMGASRDGVYLPLRLSGPNQPFARSVPLGIAYRGGGASAEMTAFDLSGYPLGATLRPTGNRQLLPGSSIPWVFTCAMWVGDPNAPNNDRLSLDSGYDNINIGVVIFRGLAGQNGGAFGAALQIKTIAGLEVAPNPEASDRVFTEPPAVYEAKALEAYYSLCLELKDAYPSSYNSLESIWDAIKSVASNIWDIAKPAVKTVAEKVIPMAVERGGQLIVDGLSGGLTGARRGTRSRQLLPAPRLLTYRAPSASSVRSVARTLVKGGSQTRSRRVRVRAR